MHDVMELFHLYKNNVYRLAVSYTRSVQDAEDVCQTVFLKLMKQDRLTPGKEKAWHRIVVYLFYYEGYSVKEIADILHISSTAVTTRLSRARRILEEELKKEV